MKEEDIKKIERLGWEEEIEEKDKKEKKTILPFLSWEDVFILT